MITNYADARKKMIEAAQELYGEGSAEAVAVTRAYAAINVGADIDETEGAQAYSHDGALQSPVVVVVLTTTGSEWCRRGFEDEEQRRHAESRTRQRM